MAKSKFELKNANRKVSKGVVALWKFKVMPQNKCGSTRRKISGKCRRNLFVIHHEAATDLFDNRNAYWI